METLANQVAAGLLPYLLKNLVFLIPAMFCLTIIVQAAKRFMGKNRDGSDFNPRIWQIIAILSGICYMAILTQISPLPLLVSKYAPAARAFQVVGIGVFLGMTNILTYDVLFAPYLIPIVKAKLDRFKKKETEATDGK